SRGERFPRRNICGLTGAPRLPAPEAGDCHPREPRNPHLRDGQHIEWCPTAAGLTRQGDGRPAHLETANWLSRPLPLPRSPQPSWSRPPPPSPPPPPPC